MNAIADLDRPASRSGSEAVLSAHNLVGPVFTTLIAMAVVANFPLAMANVALLTIGAALVIFLLTARQLIEVKPAYARPPQSSLVRLPNRLARTER